MYVVLYRYIKGGAWVAWNETFFNLRYARERARAIINEYGAGHETYIALVEEPQGPQVFD